MQTIIIKSKLYEVISKTTKGKNIAFIGDWHDGTNDGTNHKNTILFCDLDFSKWISYSNNKKWCKNHFEYTGKKYSIIEFVSILKKAKLIKPNEIKIYK